MEPKVEDSEKAMSILLPSGSQAAPMTKPLVEDHGSDVHVLVSQR